MIRYVLGIFLIALAVLTPSVEAVSFADDYFTLYENDIPLADQAILIFSNYSGHLSFEEIYNGNMFVRSQSMITNLTFYKLNSTTILDYETWVETKNNASYSMYVQQYIQGLVNDSLDETTVEIPEVEDKEVYNQPLIGLGGMIGRFRYFDVDLNTGTIELTETRIPETPAFEVSVMIVATIALLLLYKHKKR